MATSSAYDNTIPSKQRSVLITAVAAGDKIDIEALLGRPAYQIKFSLTDATDVIEFKLNNYISLQSKDVNGNTSTVRLWSSAPQFPTFSATGSTEHMTSDGLKISSVEIVSLTLSTGTTIDIVAW